MSEQSPESDQLPPSALRDLLGQMGWLPPVRLGALWTAAAGEVLSQNTRVAGRTEDSLKIECSSPGWQDQVREIQSQLLERLHQLELTWVQSLELSVRQRPAEASASSSRSTPIPPEFLQKIHERLEPVESPSVRSALEKILIRRAQASLSRPVPPEPGPPEAGRTEPEGGNSP